MESYENRAVPLKKREEGGTGRSQGVGTASVLMIVMVLAFTTFGVLALSSAMADARMSEKALERVSKYYEAEGRLQQRLAEFEEALSLGNEPEPVDGLWILIEDVTEGQQIQMALQESGSGSGYVVLWQRVVNTGEWNPDTGFDVWDGGM